VVRGPPLPLDLSPTPEGVGGTLLSWDVRVWAGRERDQCTKLRVNTVCGQGDFVFDDTYAITGNPDVTGADGAGWLQVLHLEKACPFSAFFAAADIAAGLRGGISQRPTRNTDRSVLLQAAGCLNSRQRRSCYHLQAEQLRRAHACASVCTHALAHSALRHIQ
jgi:hypothetical protein